MNKKTTGLVAGAAGAALLMGGATFALWSDSANVEGGRITAGNLDVEAVAPVWNDVSADRSEGAHVIDLDTFRIVPGDTIEGKFGFRAALEGDNMVAELSLADLDGYGNPAFVAALASEATYEVYVDGEIVDHGDITDAESIFLASEDNTQNRPELPALPADLPADANVELVVFVTFPDEIAERDLVEASAKLKDFRVTLTQSRDAGVGGGY